MKYTKIDNILFIKNRQKLLKSIDPDALVIVNSNDEMPRNGDQNFAFRQNSDLFYLTGLDQEKCILCLCPSHPVESMREIVFTNYADETMVIWYGNRYSLDDAKEVSGVKTVKWLSDFESTLKELMTRVNKVYLALNEAPKYLTEVPYKELRFANKLKQEYPTHEIKRLAPALMNLRAAKEPEEIALLQKACDITEKAFDRVLKFVKPGVNEYEVEAEIIHEFIRNGANGHAYAPIVATGKNACILHYVENNIICKDGELLLLDFGAEYANYAGDLSRTIPVNGKFTARQKDCYNALLRVFREAVKLFVPGNTIDKLHAEVCKIMEKEMIGLGLFTAEEVKNQNASKPMYFKYFMHGTSHFIGLDVHDVGTRQLEFKKGMVLSCEPGLYIEEENIGIRIENDIMVDDIPVDLMKNIPIEADEIERIMACR
jgi:Xaa-Pro aminopeptidase